MDGVAAPQLGRGIPHAMARSPPTRPSIPFSSAKLCSRDSSMTSRAREDGVLQRTSSCRKDTPIHLDLFKNDSSQAHKEVCSLPKSAVTRMRRKKWCISVYGDLVSKNRRNKVPTYLYLVRGARLYSLYIILITIIARRTVRQGFCLE